MLHPRRVFPEPLRCINHFYSSYKSDSGFSIYFGMPLLNQNEFQVNKIFKRETLLPMLYIEKCRNIIRFRSNRWASVQLSFVNIFWRSGRKHEYISRRRNILETLCSLNGYRISFPFSNHSTAVIAMGFSTLALGIGFIWNAVKCHRQRVFSETKLADKNFHVTSLF